MMMMTLVMAMRRMVINRPSSTNAIDCVRSLLSENLLHWSVMSNLEEVLGFFVNGLPLVNSITMS